jgi:asparagine synthetase A
MHRLEIIRSYYVIMWDIWHEIMNSSLQSNISFVTELLNLVYRLNVRYSNPKFCQTQFMQEYPINSSAVYNRAGDSLSRIN